MNEILISTELGLVHEGSLGIALSLIDAACDAGANAIKMQMHIAEEESTYHEPWRKKISSQDTYRYDYWKRTEFSFGQWKEIAEHIKSRNMKFICSPFSVKAVKDLEKLGVDYYKIASGQVSDIPLLEAIQLTKKPVIISTGMSSIDETKKIYDKLKKTNNEIIIMQCTSMYPCTPYNWGLNMIQEYKNIFPNVKIGFSDHSGQIAASIAAVALGCEAVEVHITFNKKMYGYDTDASITVDELPILITSLKNVKITLDNPLNKSKIDQNQEKMRKIFTKVFVANADMKENHIIKKSDLNFKKAGEGINYENIKLLIGKRLNRNIKKNEPIKLEDLK